MIQILLMSPKFQKIFEEGLCGESTVEKDYIAL